MHSALQCAAVGFSGLIPAPASLLKKIISSDWSGSPEKRPLQSNYQEYVLQDNAANQGCSEISPSASQLPGSCVERADVAITEVPKLVSGPSEIFLSVKSVIIRLFDYDLVFGMSWEHSVSKL